jgi:SSS family solute:Na+ symporter
MFASKSVWDFKMTVGLAGLCMIVMSYFNLTMGVFGRALYPDVAQLTADGTTTDKIYPYLVSQLQIPGVTGLIVAGIFAASLSTYDSIGSSISALLTRDVYARLLVKDRDDAHYLRVGQWLTPAIIGISFLYMPFLLEGTMFFFFLDITSAFVVPLLTLFLVGRFTRVHSSSGTIGLIVGSVYGVLRLCAPWIAQKWGVAILPVAMVDSYAAYPFAVLITTAAMFAVSLVRGWQPRGVTLESAGGHDATWLRSSQQQLRDLGAGTEALVGSSGFRQALPAILALAVVALGCFLCFVVFW